MIDFATAFISLGSNLQNPHRQLDLAIDALSCLPNTQQLTCSPRYQNPAIGPGEQPDYVNAVVKLQTQLDPLNLLHEMQTIEKTQGRKRDERWGARTIDLDLLLYDNLIIHEANLVVPHPEIYNRLFVLQPLKDLAPELAFPNGQLLEEVLIECTKNTDHPLTRVEH